MTTDQAERPRRRTLVITFGPFGTTTGGFAVRSRAVVSALRACGAEVMVLSIGEQPTSTWTRRNSLWVPDGLIGLRGSGWFRWSVSLARVVRKLSGSIDLIVVESALFLIPILAVTRCPIIWDGNGCQTAHYRSREQLAPSLLSRLHMHLAGTVWHEIERWAARRCIVLVAQSEAEAGRWQEAFPRVGPKIHIVDLIPEVGAGHDPLGDGLGADTSRSAEILPVMPDRYVAFVGGNSKHNVDAARWCVHTLARQLPSTVSVVLAGVGTDTLVRAAGNPPGVLGLGYVDDVDRVLSNAELCIAPMATGEGPETKVLHYVALGCRIAATPLALEGLADAPGCRVAELDELPKLVGEMLVEGEPARDRDARQLAQRRWMEKYVAPRRIREQWMSVLSRVWNT